MFIYVHDEVVLFIEGRNGETFAAKSSMQSVVELPENCLLRATTLLL